MADESCPSPAHIAEQGHVSPEEYRTLSDSAWQHIFAGANSYKAFEESMLETVSEAVAPERFTPLIPDLWKRAISDYENNPVSKKANAPKVIPSIVEYMPQINHIAYTGPTDFQQIVFNAIRDIASRGGVPAEYDVMGRRVYEEKGPPGKPGKLHIPTSETARVAREIQESDQLKGLYTATAKELNARGISPSVITQYLVEIAAAWRNTALDTAKRAMADPENIELRLEAARAQALAEITQIESLKNTRELGRALRQLQHVNTALRLGTGIGKEYERVFGGTPPMGKTNSDIPDEVLTRTAEEFDKSVQDILPAPAQKPVPEPVTKRTTPSRPRPPRRPTAEGVDVLGIETPTEDVMRDPKKVTARARQTSFIMTKIKGSMKDDPSLHTKVLSLAERLKQKMKSMKEGDEVC